jgi:extracellular solute-binding protein (family 5)
VIPRHRHVVLLALLAAACRAGAPRAEFPLPPPAPTPGGGDTTCTIAAGRPVARDTVTIAVTDAVDPGHAPLPRNDAERLVFAQLYESLIRVDCQGRALPGLAAAWEQAPEDRWAFTLRESARFWDGAPVTARDVLAAWRSHDPALATNLAVTGDRTFTLPASDAPFQRLADQALAVTKPAPGGGWPIGTGRYWMTSGDPASPDALVAQPMARTGHPVVKIATVPASAARDALDREAGVLITDDPAALEYAKTLPGYVDVPLEWSRTYVLLTPGRDKAGVGDLRLESLREAVRGDARPAEWSGAGRFWFTDLQACGIPAARDTLGSAARRRRVVYKQTDRSAADLAARLVGLGALGRGAVAAGVAPSAFESALRAGSDLAYVLELRRRVYDACRAALELPPWSAAGTIQPLLDVRSHAVMRRGLPRMALDWDGTLRLVPP